MRPQRRIIFHIIIMPVQFAFASSRASQSIPNQNNIRQLVRSAILDNTENIERIRFFETVAINRGLNAKIFDDEDLAVEWLKAGR